jgi:hypothetical protein
MIWDKVFFWGFAIAGLGIGAYLIWSGWESVERPDVSTPSDYLNSSSPK